MIWQVIKSKPKRPFTADRRNICAAQTFGIMINPEKDKAMASSAGQKPLILTAAEADHQRAEARAEANARLAERQVNPVQDAASPIAYIVAALILARRLSLVQRQLEHHSGATDGD